MTELLGQNIIVVGANIDGRIVGVEQRDTSRSGSGATRPFVCVDVDGDLFWRWHPLTSVQFTSGDQPPN